jgi:hypothetical protein
LRAKISTKRIKEVTQKGSSRTNKRKEEKEGIRKGMDYFIKLKPIELKGGLK